MDRRLASRFYEQIWLQCRFALAAYDDVARSQIPREPPSIAEQQAALEQLSTEERHLWVIEEAMEVVVRMWGPVQAMLTAVANISKALWGGAGKEAPAREPLRRALQVDDSSPLRLAGDMRNNFDHYDKALVEWFGRTKNPGLFIDYNNGPITGNVADEDIFRWFDPRTGELVFWGQRYDFHGVAREARRIGPLAFREAFGWHDATDPDAPEDGDI